MAVAGSSGVADIGEGAGALAGSALAARRRAIDSCRRRARSVMPGLAGAGWGSLVTLGSNAMGGSGGSGADQSSFGCGCAGIIGAGSWAGSAKAPRSSGARSSSGAGARLTGSSSVVAISKICGSPPGKGAASCGWNGCGSCSATARARRRLPIWTGLSSASPSSSCAEIGRRAGPSVKMSRWFHIAASAVAAPPGLLALRLRSRTTILGRLNRRASRTPSAAPSEAMTSAIRIRAVTPSGGAAAGMTRSIPIFRTRLSISVGRIARLPRPNRAPNHSATTAGNSGWLEIGLRLPGLRFELATPRYPVLLLSKP